MVSASESGIPSGLFSYGNKIFHVGGAGPELPVECWEFTPGRSTEEVEIAIHQSTETMHYWYPYANSFILSLEQTSKNEFGVPRLSSRPNLEENK